MDLGIDTIRTDGGDVIDQEFINLGNGFVPQLGDVWTVTVTYADGSVENLQATVSFIPAFPIVTVSGNPVQFSWSSPLPGGMLLGDLGVALSGPAFFTFTFTDPFAAPPVLYTGPALTSGTTYFVDLFTRDVNGNRGETDHAFVAP
jgi:hypothetical protein